MTVTRVALVLFYLLKFLDCIEEAHQKPCIPRSYGESSIVCVCNSTYRDTIPRPVKLSNGQYIAYTTSKSGLRFKKEHGEFQPTTEDDSSPTTIDIKPTKRYQTIVGWGGSFTDSTGININSLSSAAAENLLRSYFSEDGLEYGLCRVPGGATDFSTRPYSYNDGEEDPELNNFKLAPEDYKYKIPWIKVAQKMTNKNLDVFFSVWTAPIWIKHNGKYTGPDLPKKKMYQTWANYHLKILEAYHAEGVDVWGITTGNEPFSTGMRPLKNPCLGWLPSRLGKWVTENLGPTIRNSNHSSVKILTIDDVRMFYPWFIDATFSRSKAKEYIDGFGLHWYLNNLFPASLLTATHNKYPDKFILSTEACSKPPTGSSKPVLLGDWQRGEDYAYDIIDVLNHWAAGWVDWNMALNQDGGPNYINNTVDSPIIVNADTGEFYKQPMYYALGHFSKFVPKGSVRIFAEASSKIDAVAFIRPDNGTVVVILNRITKPLKIRVRGRNSREIKTKILPKSITTFLYW